MGTFWGPIETSTETMGGARPRSHDAVLSMSFRALAGFMLDATERGSHMQEIVGLAA